MIKKFPCSPFFAPRPDLASGAREAEGLIVESGRLYLSNLKEHLPRLVFSLTNAIFRGGEQKLRL